MTPAAVCKPLTVIAVAAWCWLAMMLVHELGHVLAAWVTGGEITSLELRPGRLSHTIVNPNPHPSAVLWGGFLAGWILPQIMAAAWRRAGGVVGPALRAWAAFCLLAGGCYLALGATERLTDTGRLVAAGWPLPLLIVTGATVAVLGYTRSGIPWIDLVAALENAPNQLAIAIASWAWLLAWCAGQGVVHRLLQPP